MFSIKLMYKRLKCSDLECFLKDESLILFKFFIFWSFLIESNTKKSFLANIDFSTEFLIIKFLIKQKNECILGINF